MYITSKIKPGILGRQLLQRDVNGCNITYGISLGGGRFPEHSSLHSEGYIHRFNGESHNSILRERRIWAVSKGCIAYAPCILSPMLNVSFFDVHIDGSDDNIPGILDNGNYIVCFIEGSLSVGKGNEYISALLHTRKSVGSWELFNVHTDKGIGRSVYTGWFAGAWGNSCDCIMLCVSKKEVKFLYEICTKLTSGMLAVITGGGCLSLLYLDKYSKFIMK